MMTRSKFPQAMVAIKNNLNISYFQWEELEGKDYEYRNFVQDKPTDDAYTFATEWAGLAGAVLTPENQVTQFTDPVPGGTAIATVLEYRTGTEVSGRMADDDKVGIVKALPAMHGRAHKFTREQVVWNTICNNAFNAVTAATCDGIAIYGNHPLLGGAAATALLPLPSTTYNTAGTYPNFFQTPLAPSVTAIQKMMVLMHRQPDGMGIPIKSMVNTIIHPAEQLTTWGTILASGYDPNSGNNAVNPITQFNLKLFEGTYLTSATNWWCFGDKAKMEMYCNIREEMTDEYFDEPKVRGVAIQMSQCFSVFVPFPYQKFGSQA